VTKVTTTDLGEVIHLFVFLPGRQNRLSGSEQENESNGQKIQGAGDKAGHGEPPRRKTENARTFYTPQGTYYLFADVTKA
jgi:hypothetical protein